MNIIDLFLEHAEKFPNKIAIIFNDQTLLYDDVRKRTQQLSGLLQDMGVRRGDCVIVLLDNSIEFSIVLLAAAELGAMLAPLCASLPANGIQKAIESTGSRFIFGQDLAVQRLLQREDDIPSIARKDMLIVGSKIEGCRQLEETETLADGRYPLGTVAVPADQDYILTLTSGSTGAPKPITLSQATKIRRSIQGAKALYGLGENDVIITSSPMYHSLGLRLGLMPMLIGATSVILETFSPAAWMEAVEKTKVTFALMVSSHLELIVKKIKPNSTDLSSLKTIVSSSALLKPDVKQACIERFDCEFHECYGASEVGIVTNLSPEDSRENLTSVGKALPFVHIQIVDEEGKVLPIGEKGEITCRSKTMFSRYFKNKEATQESLVDGYFFTGDIGYLDQEGYLTLCGRKKDMIIAGGTNVYPEDVEEVVRQVGGVKECAVIGVEDAYFGEAILAIIVEEENGADIRAIRAYCAGNLADYQQPMAYEIVSELPKSKLGKLTRHTLREQFKGYDATAMLRRLLG